MTRSSSEVHDSTPLLHPEAVSAAATAGVGFLNAASTKIHQARAEGPLTFRVYVRTHTT
jgi:hypothetical protein